MTVRFLALYETPTDPEAFDRHYREVHIPLGRRLPGLRRYAVGRDVAAVRGAPYYLVAELEWDTMEELRAAFGRTCPGGQWSVFGIAGTASWPTRNEPARRTPAG